MELRGHVGAALAAYAPFAFVALRSGALRLAVAGAALTVVLASLPDVDLHVPGVAHRGYSHTVWFAALVGAGCAAAFGFAGVGRLATPAAGPGGFQHTSLSLAAFGFAVGTVSILSHVAADSLTPMGVAPLAPLRRRRYSLGITRSADPVANRRLLLLGVATVAAAAVLGTGLAPPAS